MRLREAAMKRSRRLARQRRTGQRGQILVIAVLAMMAMIGGVALLLEGGNAYAQQRGVQNGADAAANTGAGLLAQRLDGVAETDAQIAAAIAASATANSLSSVTAYYTDVAGKPIDAAGLIVAESMAAEVGGGTNNPTGTIPLGAQGVHVASDRTFGTSFGRAIGVNQLVAGADATAVTGRLTGGNFLPVVFPVNIVDCETNGDLGLGEPAWILSGKPLPGVNHPNGPEYIVPMCKTGGSSFMMLDLDGTQNNCEEEVTDPSFVTFDQFPTEVASDIGDNCGNHIEDEVNALQGKVVMIPVCDSVCVTDGGSGTEYHIKKIASFFIDFMSGSPSSNPNCDATTSPTYGTPLTLIWGNGSSSCLAGWFVRYHNVGPVGAGPVGNSDAIGIQLIK
jgi:Flp pilus assembly protein TadG